MTKALGWIVGLLAIAAGLVFYNVGYVPMQQRISRQRSENDMWTLEVQQLRERLAVLEAGPETAFVAVHTFDELFTGPESFTFTPQGEAVLREAIPRLQELTGTIEVIGHTDSTDVPRGLKDRLPSNWEYGAARAGAVARAIAGWGVAAGRLRVTSAADALPRADNATPEGRGLNRRVEIRVMK